jgi:hypothetical protein
MMLSALFMAILGIIATFLPHELLRAGGMEPAGALPVVVQLAGALYAGFAMLNWMAKDSLIGGVYNRPAALGNFLHFFAGAFALGKGAPAGAGPLSLTIAYAVFAIAFGMVLFTSPVKPQPHAQ